MDWRDEHPHPVPISLLLGSLVDRARIVGPIGHYGDDLTFDLVQEIGHPRTIGCPAMGQIGGKDFAGFGVNRQVEFPPYPSLGRLSKGSPT